MSGTTGRIFISHASRDRHIAETVCAALEKRGLLCWISNRDVPGGDNYQEAVFRAIRSARVMVLVFTAAANRSDEIKKELALASQNRLIVIPLRVEDIAPTDAFAFELATRQWIDGFPDWERGLQRLAIRIAAVTPAVSDETVVQRPGDVVRQSGNLVQQPADVMRQPNDVMRQPQNVAQQPENAGQPPHGVVPAAAIEAFRVAVASAATATSAAPAAFGRVRGSVVRLAVPAMARARTASRTAKLVAASGLLVAIILVGWLLWPRTVPVPPPVVPPAVPLTPPAVPPAVPLAPPIVPSVPPPPVVTNVPTPEFHLETADERAIRDHVPRGLSLFRFAPNPQIVVLDFASLREQGLMLNRVAALTEKAGLPRDRVLNDAELDQAVRAGGDTIETFYYGHDYSAAELARFFATADRDGVRLNPEEEVLRRLLRQLRWFSPGIAAGLISIPKVGANDRVTDAVHNTILHNELAHGEYFSNPAYAAFVHEFWVTALTADERENVRRYLRSEEYDTSLDDLVEDNMQAYLMFTHDPAFFVPSMIEMSAARLSDLQAAFLRSMPPGWLHEALATALLVQQLTPAPAR